MPASDYTSVSGGALRIKGAAPGKPKKKKSKPKPDSEETAKDRARDSRSASPDRRRNRDSDSHQRARSQSPDREDRARDEDRREDIREKVQSNKTEAELRHEAQRRKRLDEKLKREGVKTHKEKVEDLNRYLSRLSEHHDMPKIGPG